MKPPSYSGELPEQPSHPKPRATLTFGRPNGDRRHLTLEADDTRRLDAMIIARVDSVISSGAKMIKTVMEFDGEEWAYEYDSSGRHVERTFRNGEVTP